MPANTPSASQVDDRLEENIEMPPRGLWATLKQLGPGLIIAGSIVGSGELIATTKAGAQAGISLLWLIIFGCVIKIFAQMELGRYSITHGETTLTALNRVPGKIGPVNWIVWFWLAMVLVGIAQLGGIVGGIGQAAAITMPLTGDYAEAIAIPSENQLKRHLDFEAILAAEEGLDATDLTDEDKKRVRNGYRIMSALLEELGPRGAEALATVRVGKPLVDPYTFDDKYWAGAATVITMALLYFGRYGLIQSITTVLVVSFTFITIGNVISLQNTTQWHISFDEILRGLSLGLPSGENGLATALASFGIIGVGASELVSYPYWCLEKGYAKHTGPREETDEWLQRAKGWLKVMHYDVYLSMVVYTVATVAFYLLGVAVLFREGRDPENMRMVSTLASAYVPVFGPYARWLFLFGAIAVLYSTFMVSNAAYSRMYPDFLKLVGLLKRDDEKVHDRAVAIFGAVLPLLCLIVLCTGIDPVEAVLLTGIMQGLLLPMLGIATLYFRYTLTDPRLKPSKLWDLMLFLSVISFVIVAYWTVNTKGAQLLSVLMS